MEKDFICCNEKMRHTNLGYYECSICHNQIEDELGLIKRTLEEHPGANAIELVRLTNIPSKTILKYLNDGSLSNVKHIKNIRGYYMGSSEAPKWHIDVNFLKDK